MADEAPDLGGKDAGPAPYELLLASARRLQRASIERVLSFEGDLAAEQRARLAEIAERTPVTLTLKGGVEIRTELR